MVRDTPLFELTLRKYEPPTGDLDKDLRTFLLSLGMVRPGDQKSPLEVIFKAILTSKKPIAVDDLAKMAGVTESAVRYHLERLKALRLVDGRKEYYLAETDLSVAFKVFRRYVLEELLDRIDLYVSELQSLIR
ncbi:MAG: winged helix-turn-helix transcriptional regulator [Candidatus Altiarchaeota archaeon]|nr:winged helix-turn-helix transcriptional regulator [Candidatus Altiarchaeota archaeon]